MRFGLPWRGSPRGLKGRPRERIEPTLWAGPATGPVDAAIARLLIPTTMNFEATTILAQLERRCVAPAAQLRALLAAGDDDDVWNPRETSYHTCVTNTIRELVKQHPTLFPSLMDALRTASTGSGWTRRRIVLGTLAACAEAMPQLFKRTRPATWSLCCWQRRRMWVVSTSAGSPSPSSLTCESSVQPSWPPCCDWLRMYPPCRPTWWPRPSVSTAWPLPWARLCPPNWSQPCTVRAAPAPIWRYNCSRLWEPHRPVP